MDHRQHIIRSIRIEVTTAADPFTARQQAESLVAKLLPARLEQLLLKYELKEMIHIPSIRLHIRGTNWDEVEQEVISLCCEEVEKQVRTIESNIGAEEGFLFHPDRVSGKEKNERPQFSEAEILFRFLQTGTMPWWSTYQSVNELEQDIISLLEENSSAVVQIMTWFRELNSTRIPLERMMNQFSMDLLKKLLVPFNQNRTMRLEEFISGIERMMTEAAIPSIAKTTIRKVFLLELFEKLISEDYEKLTLLENFVRTQKGATELTVAIRQRLETGDFTITELRNTLTDFYMAKDEPAPMKGGPVTLSLPEEKTRESPPPQKQEMRETRETIDLDQFFIHNAGLVILHPYLERFFAHLELLDRDGLIKRSAVHHAIQLLQFCSTGETDSPEFHLILNKILCGVPLEFPAEKTEITEEEKLACQDLLKSVIKNWSALKNTSPSALQHTFFRREGKLQWKSGTWWLKVELKTEDVLLDRLPWSFSRIRLRWMPHWLRVEWNS